MSFFSRVSFYLKQIFSEIANVVCCGIHPLLFTMTYMVLFMRQTARHFVYKIQKKAILLMQMVFPIQICHIIPLFVFSKTIGANYTYKRKCARNSGQSSICSCNKLAFSIQQDLYLFDIVFSILIKILWKITVKSKTESR